MSAWSPTWRVLINAVEYTSVTLATLSISSGRTNIYTQAQAGYCNVTLINLDASNVLVTVNDILSVEIKDSSGTFVPIFTGSVMDIAIDVAEVGTVQITQTVTIMALGALARLQKALTPGVLTQDFDGNQILSILTDLLVNNWSEVPPSLTWGTYTPASETWANAQNTGLGQIDTPGNYELAARSSSTSVIWNLVAALATSGLGYIYENTSGQVSYADSTHRSIYLATHGYTNLSANQALGQSIRVQVRGGDIRNDIDLSYASGTVISKDLDSIATYGYLEQQISTTIFDVVEAQAQADFYITLRAYPQAFLESITFALTNPELSDITRDALISTFMGQPISLADLPLNMSAGNFLGFVEGYRFSASYNQLSVTLLLSPLAFSIQAMQWQDVSVAEAWNTIVATLDWEHALVVA